MQVDQFESEVESLSVQTRKKKGDKEVGILVFSFPFSLFFLVSFSFFNVQCFDADIVAAWFSWNCINQFLITWKYILRVVFWWSHFINKLNRYVCFTLDAKAEHLQHMASVP